MSEIINLKTVFNQAPVGIYVTGSDHIIQTANLEAKRLLPSLQSLGLAGQVLPKCFELFGFPEPCQDCPITTGQLSNAVLPVDGSRAVSRTASPIVNDAEEIIGVQHIIVPNDSNLDAIKELTAMTKTAQTQRAMIELGRALLDNEFSMQKMVDDIFEPIQQLISCDALGILLLDDKAGNLQVTASHGHSKNGNGVTDQIILILPHIMQMIESKETIIIQDTATDSRWQTNPGSEWIASSIGVPLVKKAEDGSQIVVGLLHLDGAKPNSFTEQHIELLKMISGHLSMAIENTKLHEELSLQAIRDPLTELYNRRYMEEALNQKIDEAIRSSAPLQVVMCDIDLFKKFNDNFSHAAGDLVLIELAKIFKESFRGSDISCRYGGEEFVFVLPDTISEVTIDRLHELQKKISQLKLQHEGRPLPPITMSFGLSSFPRDGNTLDILLNNADAALHKVKNGERNGINIFGEDKIIRD